MSSKIRFSIEVFTDGATVGHNGKLGTVSEVGIGVYCPTTGYRFSDRVQGISNNEAEFKALISGMEYVVSYWKRKQRKAVFYMDSMIVVNRAKGKRPRKSKNDRMDAFQDTVLELATKFKEIDFKWMPRERNTIADSLSKKATYKQ